MNENQLKEKPKIGFWMSTSLVVGNMTGSGIFLLPAALAFYGGVSLFGWLFTTIGAIFLALVFARLSKIIPKAGGPYAYAREGFGDFTGFLVVWGYWVSVWCGNAAIAAAGVGYLSVFIPVLKDNSILSGAMAILSIWIFTYINTKSIRSVGRVQVITTVLKIIPLVAFGTIGFLYFKIDNFTPFNVSDKSTLVAITSTAALTLWAFLGMESATVPSDKVKNPTKTIPRATLAGTIVAAVIFISSTMAVMGVIGPKELQTSSAPFADAAKTIWGNWASYAVALGAAISCFGALNGWILLTGQMPYAAAKDKIFPERFQRVSKKNVPLFGIIIASILASFLVSMNYTKGLVGMFSFMIMLATMTVLFPYVVSSCAEVVIYLKGKNKPPKRVLIKALVISVPAGLYSIWALLGLGYEVILWGIVLLIIGIPFYFYFNYKRRKDNESSIEI